VDVEVGQGCAGLVLASTDFLEGGGLEVSHDFGLLCFDLHTIWNPPFLADM